MLPLLLEILEPPDGFIGPTLYGTLDFGDPIEPPDPTLLEGVLEFPDGSAGARTRPGEYPDPDEAPGFVVKLVEPDGTVVKDLPYAVLSSIEWAKKTEEVIEFEAPLEDPDTGDLVPAATEVQVYLDDDLLAWGRVWSDDEDSSKQPVGLQARGLFAVIRRRRLGPSATANRLTNGDFEAGLTGWTVSGPNSVVGTYTAADRPLPDLPDPHTGTRAVYAVGPRGRERYVSQRIPILFDGNGGKTVQIDARWNLAAITGVANLGRMLGVWIFAPGSGAIYADPGDGFLRLAAEETEWIFTPTTGRGRRKVPRPGYWPYPTDEDPVPTEPPDSVLYRDATWWPISKTFVTPNFDASWGVCYLEVRLYFAGGLAAWDSVSVIAPEVFAPDPAGEDQAHYAGRMIDYAQNGPGKSDLRIGRRTPATGVLLGPDEARNPVFDMLARPPVDKALEDVAGALDGFDYGIEVTPTTRTFVTYYPRQGVDRRGSITLRIGDLDEGGTIAKFTRSRNAGEITTTVVARTEVDLGEGVKRTLEAFASDTSETGGLVLEDVLTVTDVSTLEQLQAIADDEVARRHRLPKVFSLTVVLDDTTRVLRPGDLVGLDVSDGIVVEVVDLEIVKVKLNAQARTLDLTVNPWED